MTAVHLRTTNVLRSEGPPRIKRELSGLPGVRRVVVFHDITSVLFDEDVVDIASIRERMASAGFGAKVLTQAMIAQR